MLTRLSLSGAVLALLLVVMSGRPDDKADSSATPIDFQINTADRPLFVRLHLEVDGQPLETAFRAAHKDHLRALFPYLDRNGDGTLDDTEARGLPLPMFRLPDSDSSDNVHVAHNFTALDLDGDRKVTPTELAAFYEEFEGGAFLTRTPPGLSFNPGAVSVRFFSLLDANGDGKLSRQEIAKVADVLAKVDANSDDLVSLAEVSPQQVPQGLEVNEFVVPAPAPAQRSPLLFDAQQLQGRVPDLELRVRLGDRPTLEVLRTRDKDALTKSETDLLLNLPRTRLELRLDRSHMTARSLAVLRERGLREFRTADANGDGFVDRDEAGKNPFVRDLFPILDRTGINRVSADQMRDYCEKVLPLQARTMARRVSLVASEGTLGLWDLLDRNRDGVLGPRELRHAAALLLSLDRNRDGIVERDELPTSFLLQLGAGQTDFRRLSGEELLTFTADGRLAYVSGAEGGGPLWFRKMDRNGDGDLSPREFLGTPEDFKRLDRDGDGLIGRAEAEQASSRQPVR